jgi:hypothetical protein
MTTFERVRRNILRDMASSKVHTAEGWCQIMLSNTANLTNVEEQKKFWNFLQNPADEERAAPICDVFEKHQKIEMPETTVVDNVVLHNTFTRNGMTVYQQIIPEDVDEKEEKSISV